MKFSKERLKRIAKARRGQYEGDLAEFVLELMNPNEQPDCSDSPMTPLQRVNEFLTEIQLTKEHSLVDRARHISIQAHVDQTRWNGDAYVTHPIQVAESLYADDEKVVAYLHDVVEDTDVTLDMLRDFGFTEVQVLAVDSVTRRDSESYLEFVLRSSRNHIGRRVKAADIRDNLRDLGGDTNRQRKEKYELALWIVEHAKMSKVVETPGICDGLPRIDGTRITVESLLMLHSSRTDEEILTSYPHLTQDDLDAAWSYGE